MGRVETDSRIIPKTEDQDEDRAKRKSLICGKWRSKVRAEEKPSELDSKTLDVRPGPPVELETTEHIAVSGNRGLYGKVAT